MKPIESKRVALDRKIVLRFPDFDGFVTEYAGNLSMTGMFVRSKEPQAAGTPVSFELRLEDGAPLVRGSGWVVWSRSEAAGPDRPAGMGVEFTELDHKSRRLVRWMILNQLPEGRKPYDVHAGTASLRPVGRAEVRTASLGSRWAGILTAVVIFGALAAVVFFGGYLPGDGSAGSEYLPTDSGYDPPVASATAFDSADSPAPSSLENADTGSTESGMRSGDVQVQEAIDAASALGNGRPLEAGPDREVTEAVESAEAESTVRTWVGAWSNQDVDSYLSHYASDFDPGRGLSLNQWKELRRQRLTAPKSIRVALARLETRIVTDGEARVSFLQTYRSDGYSDTVDKVLELRRENGLWKIRRELSD